MQSAAQVSQVDDPQPFRFDQEQQGFSPFAAARVVMRELAGGPLINSRVAFDFGAGVEDVYLRLAEMTGPDGEPYVDSAEEELAPAA